MAQAMAADAVRPVERLTALVRTAGQWTVALTSVGLVGGLVMWGHDTMTREIEGVPVIHAFAGKMRIAPGDAGGEQVRYRELTVGRIAEGEGVQAPPSTVRVAATGTDLSPDDFVTPAVEAKADPRPAPADPLIAQRAAIGNVISVMTAVQEVPAEMPGVARSPRPIARPALMAGAMRGAAMVTAAQQGTELDPATISAGTPLAQLGAFPDADSARAAWALLSANHESLLASRDRLVIEVPVAGRVLWRLRVAGFETREDAVRFCSALSAAGSDCIPTVHG